LIGNAVKFTDTGLVEVVALSANHRFEISVRDTGPGIAPEHQNRIFDEFQQVDDSNTRKKGGSGLGLAISKRIIEMHGGIISLQSKPGFGATFKVAVPIVADTKATPK
jgi:signal transduction histidine kinase